MGMPKNTDLNQAVSVLRGLAALLRDPDFTSLPGVPASIDTHLQGAVEPLRYGSVGNWAPGADEISALADRLAE